MSTKDDKIKTLDVIDIRNMSKKTNGNSDIVLGVPKSWRVYLGIDTDYMGGDHAVTELVQDADTGQYIIQYKKLVF